MKESRFRNGWRQFAVIALSVAVLVVRKDSLGQEELADGADFNALLRARTKISQIAHGEPTDSTRHYADDFRNTYGLAIFLDRRVDPDRPLALSAPEMRLELLLREVARKQNMGLVVREGYLYVGPPVLCRWWPSELESLQKQVEKLPVATKQFWQSESRTWWNEGSTPRQLAQTIGGSKIAASELERIPHDVWAEFDGPELPRWEQLAIACAGFDLVPDIAASGNVTFRPLAIGKSQPAQINVPATVLSETIENIQRYFPEVKAVPKQGKLALEGSSGEIKAIGSWFAAPAAAKKPSKKKPSNSKPSGPVILLTTPVEVPARQLLLKLAEAAKCELVIAPDVQKEKVDAKIKPAWKGTRDELLMKISEAIGLNCEFRDGNIAVSNL